ncbi:YqcI/YcgG family protein [Xenorhabdus bovienii]|uniref:YqcI/YcgG family protein n=1 Tax=Xenorhabdus bovienii str. oregonense TaxID=1398202 RepID=A0A077PAQ1_XENBV|nr:YqcI/YcgG family protein [Xenorhabdus bovienii]MDE9536683.1 YqcI/YcgG family protein [Xenorhabdus bovienii]MDE9541119.1 YqcI/YcgG family protein [Xenorhabdus bovienii]MDE9589678.1 YqcI/YcgG family protein [Xenorhabdus bovienii]CDH06771.1 conserved hypothetical protein [Xenorhabdus bovienii str. oregonense]
MNIFDKNHGIKILISQTKVNESEIDWHRAVFRDIESRLDDIDFPCVFSKRAFRKKLLKFIFIADVDASGISHLGSGLEEYVEISKNWDGDLNTAYPLIVAFSLDAINAQSVDDYYAFGWKILQDLHDIDSVPWPESVDKDPHSSSWSMCFNGMQLFCNMSSPTNQVRRSRNLGKHFILVINPRERFDIVAGNTPDGHKVRSNIRSRINNYDSFPHSLQLASYGSNALEWQQYGLLEENIERTDRCPFVFRKK